MAIEVPRDPSVKLIGDEGRRVTFPNGVVGGVVLYKPVDRVAARVVMKCPWWANQSMNLKPNEQMPEFRQRHRHKRRQGLIQEGRTRHIRDPWKFEHIGHEERQRRRKWWRRRKLLANASRRLNRLLLRQRGR